MRRLEKIFKFIFVHYSLAFKCAKLEALSSAIESPFALKSYRVEKKLKVDLLEKVRWKVLMKKCCIQPVDQVHRAEDCWCYENCFEKGLEISIDTRPIHIHK